MRRKRTVAPAAGVPVQHPQPANDDQVGKVFTVPELAKRWRVVHHTVMAAIKAGRLQAFRVGERVWRVREAEVLRYEQQQHLTEVAS